MKGLGNWALVLLMVVFFLVAAFGQAQSQDIMRFVDGEFWATLNQREKGILVSGIVSGIVASAYAEAGLYGRPKAIFDRINMEASLAEIVANLDAFYSDPEMSDVVTPFIVLVRQCAGGQFMGRAIMALPDPLW
jgi:hypothetical protein